MVKIICQNRTGFFISAYILLIITNDLFCYLNAKKLICSSYFSASSIIVLSIYFNTLTWVARVIAIGWSFKF